MQKFSTTKLLVILFAASALLFLSVSFLPVPKSLQKKPDISSFQECLEAGGPILESYPRQCRFGGETFVEDIDISIQGVDVKPE